MKLSAAQRRQIPKGQFGVPSKAPGSGSYPMPDANHAAAAKGFAARFASPAQRHQIDAKANLLFGKRKVKKKKKKIVRHDSRGDTYTPGAKVDSAGDRIMGRRDSRGDRL